MLSSYCFLCSFLLRELIPPPLRDSFESRIRINAEFFPREHGTEMCIQFQSEAEAEFFACSRALWALFVLCIFTMDEHRSLVPPPAQPSPRHLNHPPELKTHPKPFIVEQYENLFYVELSLARHVWNRKSLELEFVVFFMLRRKISSFALEKSPRHALTKFQHLESKCKGGNRGKCWQRYFTSRVVARPWALSLKT